MVPPSRPRTTHRPATGPELQERLQKILSAAGVASRRRAEELIQAGRVTVNGAVVHELGARADPAKDAIALDGQRVVTGGVRRTILLHKPRGVVSTLRDPEGRASLERLVTGPLQGLFPVGRLDLQTSGLLVLTSDGALADALLRPRQAVARVYHAKVRGTPSPETLARLTRGVRLERGRAAIADVRVLERLPTKTWLEITVREGRWHVVRRVCDAVRHPVEKLVRVAFGPVRLGTLRPGAWRDVTPRELAELHQAAGLAASDVAAATAPRPRARDKRPRTPRPRAAAPPRGEVRTRTRARPATARPGLRPRRPRPRP